MLSLSNSLEQTDPRFVGTFNSFDGEKTSTILVLLPSVLIVVASGIYKLSFDMSNAFDARLKMPWAIGVFAQPSRLNV